MKQFWLRWDQNPPKPFFSKGRPSTSRFVRGGRYCPELLSNLVYGRPESSGFPAHLSLVNPIDELHVGDHAGQMTEAA